MTGMENTHISKIPITDLIPQRAPLVMIDRLVSCNMTDAVTEYTVVADGLFCEHGTLSAAGMMENMAQSCAARMGWVCRMRDEGIKIGVIGEIKNCNFLRHPAVGEKVSTHVHIIEDVFNLTLATATMNAGDEQLASVTMKIALVDDINGKR